MNVAKRLAELTTPVAFASSLAQSSIMATATPTCVASVTVGPHTELKAGHGTAASDYDIHADVGDILFTKEQLAAKTAELGKVLGKEYVGKRPLLMPILKGGFICKLWGRAGLHGQHAAADSSADSTSAVLVQLPQT
jgi:hypothetical protein